MHVDYARAQTVAAHGQQRVNIILPEMNINRIWLEGQLSSCVHLMNIYRRYNISVLCFFFV